MAQISQATPTVQANIAGTTSTVNLRDWLNTRLGPFLKKAIIESLDSEAQYPLQWLGEQLILQSIEFEGNPDATNIRERFVYKHEISSRSAQPVPSPAGMPSAEITTGQQHQAVTAQIAASDLGTTESEPTPVVSDPTQVARVEVEQTAPAQPEDSTAVNGTTTHPTTEVQPQDTEMSNAP